ncbi:MAG TPA: hypothetical protein VIF62_23665 [Labilithrix sp.]
MNVYKPIAIVSTSALVVLLACGGGNEAVHPAHAGAEQPHMVAARDHLREARASLDRAEANKGGHREKAIELVDGAIRQVDDGIEWAKTH